MIEKYAKNSAAIRDAFDKLLLYIGIDDYSDIPIVYNIFDEFATYDCFETKIMIRLFCISKEK